MLNDQHIILSSHMTKLNKSHVRSTNTKATLELTPPKVDEDLETHLEYIR